MKLVNVVNLFFAIGLISPIGKVCAPSFEQTWFTLNQLCCKQRFEIDPACDSLDRISSIFFAILLLFPLGKGCGSLFEQTWIVFTQGCLSAKFDWIWPSGCGEEDFIKFHQCIFATLLI